MRRFYTLLAITLLTVFQGFSQSHINYDRDTRWFLGVNLGGTWTTQTEVDYRVRMGYGFTFGKSFGMDPDKIFSWDLRGRFLHAWFQGQATNQYNLDSTSMIGLSHYGSDLNTYQDSLGYFIPNYRSNLVSGSIELVLNTNRLRQNTGWNLSVFGGVGIKGYHVASNLVDDDIFLSEPIYDYDQLGSTSQSSLINFQDDDFETDIVGDPFDYQVDWMPSFGFGISKQVHPAVAIGLEHKMTWTRSNLFDGMPNNFDGTPSIENDIYHYTALTAKFHLFHGRYEEDHVDHTDIDDFDTEDPVTDPIIDPVSKKKPIVDIYDPNSSPHTTKSNTFRIKANIYYVDGRSDVTFKQDGNINTNFTFNPETDQFESNVVLHPGQNLFEITGVNESGSDYESVIIIYEKEEEPLNPPIVTITNPPYTPYYTNSNIFGLVSTVLNVDNKSQIRVYLNGVNLNAFSYDHPAKVVNASLNLNEGTNTVTVTATNAAGSDSKTVEIIYRRPVTEQPPIVDFVNPGVDPYYTTNSSINIRATALHVATKSDLTIKVNGNPISSFSFNVVSKEILFHTGLIEGANIVEIKGVNNAGMDEESTTIIYSRPETPKPPIVTFIDPNVDPITVYESSYNVTAKVEHVSSAANITLKINGVVSTLFTYSTSSDLMNFTTALVEGSNVIEIKGVNEHGSDIETTTIIYKRSIPQAPPIVNITYPSVDNVVFESPDITLIASVLNVAGPSDIAVTVNGVPTGAFTYNTFTKVMNLPMVLVEGTNVVQITGTNMAGSDSKTRIIKYKKPVVPCPPTVVFVNPPTTPYVVEAAPFTVTAHTTHISSKSQIVLKHNGELIADALYSFVAGNQIIFNATLIPGSNIFEVVVENADGTASDLAVINYELDDEPCIIPTVGYISPVPYSTVDDPNVIIDAQINNHSPGTTVELKLNGVSKGYMVYNAETSIATKGVTLLEGSNAVNVIVTNECGTNQATFTLNYDAPDAPCYDPTLTAMGTTSITTLEESVSLTATSTHVSEASELVVKLNGSAIPFTFDAGTGTITIADVNLAVGSNAVTITANTECGAAVLVYNIVREECDAPVISSVVPVDGTTTESTSILVSAVISNVTEGEILMLVNGVSQAFAFDAGTSTLSEAISLSVGANTIQITATNACGSATKTINVTREIPCESIVTNLLVPASSVITSTEETYDITLNATGLTTVEQITATLNGVAVTPIFDPVSGNINLNGLTLVEGENTVVVAMNNGCSESTVTYTITYEGCEIPVIIFNSIYPGLVVTDDVFNLWVVVTNVTDASDISLSVNGAATDFDFDPETHLLTATFIVTDGTNVVEVIAAGCETVAGTGTFEYEPPCETISHTLITPNVTPTVSVESEFEVTLSVVGIETADQIGVTLNGATVPFSFNPESNIITISDINLIDGTNTVIVNLENDCSSDVVNYSIIYDGCDAPVITLGSNPTSVEASLYDFEANITNISNVADVQVLLNGAPVPFVFDPISGSLEAEMNLAVGDNTITVVANGCESTDLDFGVNYTIPCTPLSFSLSHPATLSAEVADETYNISLIVQHVEASGISVTMGGATLPFTYADNLLAINGITLADGTNTIVVALSNECSSETITYTIEHDDCNTPEINLSGNALSTESTIYTFVAVVTHVESAEQLQLTLNGEARPFAFDPETGTVTANFGLVEGANTIQLSATGCADASESIEVTYTVPCDPVTYGLVTPATLVSESEDDKFDLSLNTTHVNPETIVVTIDGTAIPHTFSGGVISVSDQNLSEGSNIITVTFGNDCSSETLTYTVEYAPCELPPTIVVNGLADGMVLSEEGLIFFATITNVDDPGDITFLFNGVATPFEYDPASDVLQAPLTLNDGSNTINIIANGCESVTGGVDVVYDPPCLEPTYTMVTPSESTASIEGDSYTITLTVGNVTADQIEVKVNGGDFPFTFSDGTVIIEVPYISVPTNSVEVNLENDCGTASVTYLITYVLVEEDCTPTVAATFADDNKSVTASSDKDLINVILNLDDGTTQLIEDVSGMSGTFEATGDKSGKCIVGVWIRSGCNISAAGEPFGDYVANPGWDGVCTKVKPCSPITYRLITPSRLSVSTAVSPYSIVFSAANVTDATGIVALVNGIGAKASFDGSRITLNGIKLKKGNNTIQFTLTNECSTETITYTVSYNPPGEGAVDVGGTGGGMQAAPVITPISPITTKSTVKTQTLSFKTKVLNVSGKGQIELYVNGNKYTGFTYSSSTKQLSAVIRLNSGTNMIKVKANNGKTTEMTYYVTYEKSLGQMQSGGGNDGGNKQGVSLTPKLERVAPSSSTFTTSNPTYVLKTRALNVMSKSGLTLTVNGAKTSNFTFSSSTKIMTAVLKLREGNNSIRITAKNGDKQSSISYTIVYKKPKQNLGQNNNNNNNNGGGGQQVAAKKPVFKYVNPTTTSKTVKSQTFVLKAKILNVKSKSDITFTMNGVKITGFTFNPNTGDLVATLKLKTGTNAIRITAKNGNQVTTVNYTIKYEAALKQQQGGLKGTGTGGTGTGGGLQQGTGSNRRGG